MSESPAPDNLYELGDVAQSARNLQANPIGYIRPVGLPDGSLPVYFDAIRNGVYAEDSLGAEEKREAGVPVCEIQLSYPVGYDAYKGVRYFSEPCFRDVGMVYVRGDMSQAFFVLCDPSSPHFERIPRDGRCVGLGSSIREGVGSLIESLRARGFEVKIICHKA